MSIQLDANTVTLLRNALHDANMAGATLAQRALDGPKARPTVRELNDVLAHIGNVQAFLRAALSKG